MHTDTRSLPRLPRRRTQDAAAYRRLLISMGGKWGDQDRFNAELKKLKKATQSAVAVFTEMALEDPSAVYKHVVGSLCHHLRKTRSTYR